MELHSNEATARLSIFEESLEYLMSLNGKEVCFFLFHFSHCFSYQWLNKTHLMKTSSLNIVISNAIGITQQKS